jgi:hypothetical protein
VDFASRLFTAKGDFSTMRVVFVGIAVLVVAVPVMAWAIVYVVHDGKGDIPTGVVTLASLVFITVTGGKYLEKKEELKADVSKADSASRSGGGICPDVGRLTGQES